MKHSSYTPIFDSAAYLAAVKWVDAGPKHQLIGGRWLPSLSGKVTQTMNPSTGQVLTYIAESDSEDVDAAVVAARRALEAPNWCGISPDARTQMLLRIADAVDRHSGELAALESIDNGMPLWLSTVVVAKLSETFRYYAGWPSKILGTTNPTDETNFIYTLREPIGVCGQINPWNVPLLLAGLKIAPPLACGNTVVLKPSELASLSTLRLAEIIQETDLPPGVLNIVVGFGHTVGARISEHPDIEKVSFTGSTGVGKRILQASAGNFKHTTLELGGKTPNIIFSDADLDRAVDAAVTGFTRNSGQICSAGTRIFVQEKIFDEVTERIVKLAQTCQVGDPFDPQTKLGPLISAVQQERVLSYVDAGKEEGATLLTGGCKKEGDGYFVMPTVFANVSNSMKIAQEEIFGPVAVIMPFKDEQDVIEQGNDSTYGLAAGIWTRDISRAHKVARALKGGRIWINTFGETEPVMPFGGYKQSGLGREFGAESISAYTQTKSIQVRY